MKQLAVVHVMEHLPEDLSTPVVYLAGPVPRDGAATSWHAAAVALFQARNFSGMLILPRPRDGRWPSDPGAQVVWEEAAQRRATVLMFWIPRDLQRLPGLTTNLEWGVWHASGKAVLGAPKDAPGMRYLRHWAARGGAPTAETLETTVERTLELVELRLST